MMLVKQQITSTQAEAHFLPALYACSHHPPLALLACLQLSQIACSPLSLGKACRGGRKDATVSKLAVHGI